MSMIVIDEKKCKRDGICVAECPLQIIEIKDAASFPTLVEDAEQRCIKCGHCVAVCPHGAFTHTMLNTESFSPVKKEFTLTVEQAGHFLRSRRSIRSYQERAVEHEKLAKLIDIARYAPTGTNSQMVSWTVVDSRPKVAQLTGMAIDLFREMIRTKSRFVKKYRLDKAVSAWDQGVDRICRGAPALVIAHAPKDYALAVIDCTSALAYLDLFAPALGLGTCWAGFFMVAVSQWQPLQQALALPEGNVACGVMMVGYPKYKYRLLPPRNEPKIGWMV